jgi:hypothetical protein
MIAVRIKNFYCVHRLLAAGADIELQTAPGKTAEDIALEKELLTMV